MELREQLNGIQHVGIPTNDIETTIAFYEKLGFEMAFRTVNDNGEKFELAPDPMNEEIQEQFKDIVVGKPETFTNQLRPILSNERLFFTDLYKDGVGEKIEDMFREMIAGPGAVKATIHKYVQK